MKKSDKIEFVPVTNNLNTELFENSYSLIDRVMSEHVKMLNEQYDEAIVKALRSVGYEFSDKNKLVIFDAANYSNF